MKTPSQDFSYGPKVRRLGCPYPVATMNLQVRGYLQQYFPSGVGTHASDH